MTSPTSLSLPPELWACVFRHLTTPHQLCTASLVARVWHQELTNPSSSAIWRILWDRQAKISSHCLQLWAKSATWQQQVAASYHLLRLTNPSLIYIPSRYTSTGDPHPADALTQRPERIDVLETLGRARAVRSFASSVLIGFDNGLGLLHRPRKNRSPFFFYDDAPQLRPVHVFSYPVTSRGIVIAATYTTLISIDPNLQTPCRRPLVWRVLDVFPDDSSVVNLTVSTDAQYAIAGFCNGHVRVVDLKNRGCIYMLSMRESADMLVADHALLVACNFFAPVSMTVWQLRDGRALHRFEQTSVGWEEITSVSGLTTTRWRDTFAIWNGKDSIRLLNARSGRFVRFIDVHSRFPRAPRTATEEAEFGAACAHVGLGKMALLADGKSAAVATSNRVLVVSLEKGALPGRQLEGARRSVLALSTDDKVIVTATSDVFGGLGSRVAGRTSIAARPVMQIWDIDKEKVGSEVVLPSAVSSISVCGDVVAAVCSTVGQVVVAFADSNVEITAGKTIRSNRLR